MRTLEAAEVQRVALLCIEHDPRRCHRSVIAEALVEIHPGTEIVDLDALPPLLG